MPIVYLLAEACETDDTAKLIFNSHCSRVLVRPIYHHLSQLLQQTAQTSVYKRSRSGGLYHWVRYGVYSTSQYVADSILSDLDGHQLHLQPNETRDQVDIAGARHV